MLIMRRRPGGINDPELIGPTYQQPHAGSGDLDAIALTPAPTNEAKTDAAPTILGRAGHPAGLPSCFAATAVQSSRYLTPCPIEPPLSVLRKALSQGSLADPGEAVVFNICRFGWHAICHEVAGG